MKAGNRDGWMGKWVRWFRSLKAKLGEMKRRSGQERSVDRCKQDKGRGVFAPWE